jgi:hypothetical protein
LRSVSSVQTGVNAMKQTWNSFGIFWQTLLDHCEGSMMKTLNHIPEEEKEQVWHLHYCENTQYMFWRKRASFRSCWTRTAMNWNFLGVSAPPEKDEVARP